MNERPGQFWAKTRVKYRIKTQIPIIAMRALAFLFVLLPFFSVAQDVKELTREMKLVFSDAFSEKSTADYQFVDTARWIITQNGKSGKDLKCSGIKVVDDAERLALPVEWALVGQIMAGDFVMEFDFLQRGKHFGVRDVCVIYGFTDAENYGFAQASCEEGRHSHGVFDVTGGLPEKIGVNHNKGVVWDYEKWQRIVVVRLVGQKSVKLYVDGVLTVETDADKGSVGRLGVGTYGSEFKIDNLKVWAR